MKIINKKSIKIICVIFSLLILCACENKEVEEEYTPKEVDAVSEITYNIEKKQLEVSNVILKCNEAYYGIVVNDSVNYSNKNNYFTTGSGLTISITDEKLTSGVNKDIDYTSIQEIEDGIFLIVKGKDETLVSETFDNVFKTTEQVYEMFSHDITSEWTKEVVITSDVVSFSNGNTTQYVYQNNGSISNKSLNGEIQPTVFYKELSGIDIPITYPEDVEDLSNYVPYTLNNYDHYITNGYTPYSAYDTSAGYIILAKDDIGLKQMFEAHNNRPQITGKINIKNKEVDNFDIDNEIYSLSEVKEYAKEVINSDNRYHVAVFDEDTKNASNYYIESKHIRNQTDETVINKTMKGVMITPSIKSVMYLYKAMSAYANTDFHSQFGCLNKPSNKKFSVIMSSHGTTSSILERTSEQFTQENYGNDWLIEGSYAYIFINQQKAVSDKLDGNVLIIYRNQGSNRDGAKDNIGFIDYNEYYLKRDAYYDGYDADLYNQSCSDISGIDSVNQIYSKESVVYFSKINEIK